MNIVDFCDIFPLGLRLFLKVGSEKIKGKVLKGGSIAQN